MDFSLYRPSLIEGGEEILQSIRNLLLLSYGDIPFRPRVGVGVEELLFSLWDPSVFEAMVASKMVLLQNQEPRISKYQLEILPGDDESQVHITLISEVEGLRWEDVLPLR
ncbi:MAG: hypothetical protein QXM12_00610 [Nitrososphaerota archaeon]